ncbi:predicted protein [Botrytis cinerea T4]|uniref:Uncharacterized protein n=1 Tax=Botryotinia fuckeliana (strain T4) TaxID=999810 RepID=G2Y3W3_BOTF4|nr:predicted protein [Botrytis cinerea T4]
MTIPSAAPVSVIPFLRYGKSITLFIHSFIHSLIHT